mmetsp:Transcript_108952/g.281580  ORF Transcript_108952/g.281580 Transcript_108952/m.281580 type:complete len:93 (-) Transcript_108952:103-381(-)
MSPRGSEDGAWEDDGCRAELIVDCGAQDSQKNVHRRIHADNFVFVGIDCFRWRNNSPSCLLQRCLMRAGMLIQSRAVSWLHLGHGSRRSCVH